MNPLRLLSTALIATCLSTGICAGDDTSPVAPDRDNFHLFLLAGQSNMAGRGDLAEANPEINPRVLMLTKDGSWQPTMDPVHYDKKIAGVELARSFAAALEQDPDITVGLIPAAIGGSPIASCNPGAYHERTNSHPYDDAVERAKRAMQDGTLRRQERLMSSNCYLLSGWYLIPKYTLFIACLCGIEFFTTACSLVQLE